MCRISCAQLAVIELLSHHPTRRVSYDDMAVQTGFDRRTIISAVKVLRLRNRLVIEPGRGPVANHYQIAA